MQKVFLSHDVIAVSFLLTACLAGCNGAVGVAPADAPPRSERLADEGTVVDWPQWRGPRHDGISPETGWKAEWPDAGPPIRWRANIGIGFSSMAVVDGRLYTMGHHAAGGKAASDKRLASTGIGEPQRGQDVVWCLATDSGSPLWRHTYPCQLVDNLHEGGPAATPTVYDGRVYTISKEGHLFCLDADDGDVLWNRMLSADLGVKMPEWGFSGSPLIDGDLLIVDGGRIAAYHRVTGDLVWQTEAFQPGYGTPVSFEHAHADGRVERLVAVLNNECLIVLRLKDGQQVARRKWTTKYATSATTPIVVGDTLFISTGYGRGCLLARLEGNELQTIYESRVMCNHMNNSVVWDGHLYGFDGSSHRSRTATLNCVDYRTGNLRWAQRGLGCGSLMLAGGKLLCLSDRGELAIVEPSPTKYRELARFKPLDGRCWTVPVLSGGHLYARDANGELVCADLRGI